MLQAAGKHENMLKIIYFLDGFKTFCFFLEHLLFYSPQDVIQSTNLEAAKSILF